MEQMPERRRLGSDAVRIVSAKMQDRPYGMKAWKEISARSDCEQ